MVDIAIDIHPREEQAVLFMATDPRNDRYLCREIWSHGDGKWVAEAIIKAINYHSYRVNRIIIDPLAKADSNNENSTYEIIEKILMQHEFMLEVASKDKDSGILSIGTHLEGPNSQASLFFFDDLIRTIYEIEGWMWDKDTNKAVKLDDHMMENLYRLLLLDTQWVPPYDYNAEYEIPTMVGRDAVTGY
jgi:hypothetical protein